MSQFDFPEVSNVLQSKKDSGECIQPSVTTNGHISNESEKTECDRTHNVLPSSKSPTGSNEILDKEISPKHTKRKLIDSYFDHKSKRKFPGPAGLLNGSFKESKDELVCHMELLSQVSTSPFKPFRVKGFPLVTEFHY